MVLDGVPHSWRTWVENEVFPMPFTPSHTALVEDNMGAAPTALTRLGGPTQPFRTGLTFSGRPSGPQESVPEASVLSPTEKFRPVRKAQGCRQWILHDTPLSLVPFDPRSPTIDATSASW